MKKTILFLLVLFSAAPWIRSQSVTITSPNGGEIWTAGNPQKIAWTFSDIPDGSTVKLVLFQNGGKMGNIVQNISIGSNKAGFHNWAAGAVEGGSVPPGTGFLIRIISMNGTFKDESDGTFELRSQMLQAWLKKPVPGQPASMQVGKLSPSVVAIAAPAKGDVWFKGDTYSIRWKSTGLMLSQHVTLSLSGTGVNQVIAGNVPNNGEFPWFVPYSLLDGAYQIRVESNVSALSDFFNIQKKLPASVPCNTGNLNADLECVINNYRKSKGLGPIPYSPALRKVAETHVYDLATQHPENGCNGNLHSWSSKGSWKGGCYHPNNSNTWPIMWLKPQEIAGDGNYGYEIACQGASTAASALGCWQSSAPHHDVIVNQGMWTQAWTGMGAALYGGYAVAWFEK